ncbi:MAG TPA: hypothetical protein VEP66_11255 [Myxococcales bacterium]|nr:hypothetical protein [Myxococcales bacterium]
MRVGMVAAAWGLMAGCTGPGTQVRERASFDFDCPEERVAIESSSAGWVARGCGKEATYLVQRDLVERNSEIRKIEDVQPLRANGIPDASSATVK